jgi:hypothetical protein
MPKNFNFLIIIILFFILSLLTQKALNYEKLLIQNLSSTLTEDQILEFFSFQKKWEWLSYGFIPLFLLIKTALVATCLYMGAFFFSKGNFTFKQLWSIAVKAEYVFLLVGVLKIVWFYFFQTNYTLEDLQYFYPLSGLNIIGYEGLEPWYIYPLQVLNLFEVAYWLVLAYFVGELAFKKETYPMQEGLKVVAISYGPALLLWVALVMFLTLNYS